MMAGDDDLGGEAPCLMPLLDAEGFYRAMGAQRVGATPSTLFPGRLLPLLRVALR